MPLHVRSVCAPMTSTTSAITATCPSLKCWAISRLAVIPNEMRVHGPWSSFQVQSILVCRLIVCILRYLPMMMRLPRFGIRWVLPRIIFLVWARRTTSGQLVQRVHVALVLRFTSIKALSFPARSPAMTGTATLNFGILSLRNTIGKKTAPCRNSRTATLIPAWALNVLLPSCSMRVPTMRAIL